MKLSFRQLCVVVVTIFFSLTLISSPAYAFVSPDLQQLLETNECNGCDLAGVDLSGKDLYGSALIGANLSGANLSEALLVEAKLKEANLTDSLTFIYLVFSIVTSEIQEIIATTLNLRAKNLKEFI